MSKLKGVYTGDRVEIEVDVMHRETGEPSPPTGAITAWAKRGVSAVEGVTAVNGNKILIVWDGTMVVPGNWTIQVSEKQANGAPETIGVYYLPVMQSVRP